MDSFLRDRKSQNPELLLMAEIVHHLEQRLSHHSQGFIHPRWCRISSINSMYVIMCLFLIGKKGMNIFSTIWTYQHTRSFPQGQMLNVFIFSWDLILQTVQRSGGWMRSLSGTDGEKWNELLNWLAKKRPGISRNWHGIASSEILLTESMNHPSWKTGC